MSEKTREREREAVVRKDLDKKNKKKVEETDGIQQIIAMD